jgi:hypothetical protein
VSTRSTETRIVRPKHEGAARAAAEDRSHRRRRRDVAGDVGDVPPGEPWCRGGEVAGRSGPRRPYATGAVTRARYVGCRMWQGVLRSGEQGREEDVGLPHADPVDEEAADEREHHVRERVAATGSQRTSCKRMPCNGLRVCLACATAPDRVPSAA